MDYTRDINGHTLEYYDSDHIYLVDGVIVPSITQLLKFRFGKKYEGISKGVLNRASDAGTRVHDAIERFCQTGEEEDLPEVRNFKFLQRQYKFEVIENEVPVILSDGEEPVSAGRLDMVIKMRMANESGWFDAIGGADIKRTSSLDKDYLFYQLNLYRVAFRQCYGVEWEFLRGIHLRENTRKFVPIPINEELAMQLVKEYMEGL